MSKPNDAPMKRLILPSLVVLALVVAAIAAGLTYAMQLVFFSLIGIFLAVLIKGLTDAARSASKNRDVAHH